MLEQTVPKTMVAGKSYSVTVSVKNVGTQVWNVIGPQFITCSFTLALDPPIVLEEAGGVH